MFPAGAPGIALFILRNCIAFVLAGCAFPVGWQHFVFVSLLGMLCIGLLTPAVCGLAVVGVLVQLAQSSKTPNATIIVIVLSSLSAAVLGPGAFSFDARLFGRRRLVSTSPSESTNNDRHSKNLHT